MSNTQFEESYVLSADNDERLSHLNTLIAGSTDYYYYNCLHLLNVDPQLSEKQNKTRFEQLSNDWMNDSSAYDYQLFTRIKNRSLLLGYSKDTSDKVFDEIKNQLGLTFHYPPTISSSSNNTDSQPQYPSKLDESKIERTNLVKQILSQYPYDLRFNHDAIPYVANNFQLNANQIKTAVQSVRYPVLDKVVEYLTQTGTNAIDVKYNSQLFNNLTIAQLDKIAAAKPEAVDTQFVTLYLSKLLPTGENNDWRSDSTLAESTYKTCYAYVNKLPATFNSQKFTVLHHYLSFQLGQNHYDLSDKFKQYCQLPRNTNYYNTDDLYTKQNYQSTTIRFNESIIDSFPPVSSDEDEKLLKSYFRKVFQTENSIDAYLKMFRPSFLKPLLAEVKLLANAGDAEKWYQMLESHSAVQLLKDRVDINFAPQNPEYFLPDDQVEIKCSIKNVQHLLVKVFEINTYNYYKTEGKQLDVNINLDGLVANQEYTYAYTEPPIQSVERTFQFPTLKGRRGLFIIEFIGNGKSSRSVIRKGKYNLISSIGQNGQIIQVLDEDSVKITKCSATVDGNVYQSNEKGDIIVPFSSSNNNVNIILTAEDFSSLVEFSRKSENYTLVGGIYLENSTFLQGEKAPIVVRGRLYLNETQINISNLEDTVLTITTTDNSKQSIVTAKEVKPFNLSDKEESTYLFKVPENVAKVSVTFNARIKDLSGAAKYRDLSFSEEIQINSIDQTSDIINCHLKYTDQGYQLHVIGKGGEKIPNKALSFELHHAISNQAISEMLSTDKDGIVHLGQLHDISFVKVYSETVYTFNIKSRLSYNNPSVIHAKVGDVISIPYVGHETSVTRSAFNLFELGNSNTVVSDCLSQIHLDKEKKEIQINKLKAGSYLFISYSPTSSINIEVSDGDVREGFIVNTNRALSYHPSLVHPLNVTASVADKKSLEIEVRNATPTTRVHVTSSYFIPQSLNSALSIGNTPILTEEYSKNKSKYMSGRALGDETTYILNRKLAKNTLPGNSLKKPSLLMQPWSIGKTTQQKESLKAGNSYDGKESAARFARHAAPISKRIAVDESYGSYQEFLKTPSVLLLNLVPDANGHVSVPLAQLSAAGQFVQVTAVNTDNVVTREVVLSHSDASFKETSLVRSLDSKNHYTEKKLITTVPSGSEFNITNADSARFTIYDTIGKVLSLVKTISPNDQLQEFTFIGEWESLTSDQKKEKFSKYYCHELAFFIYKKDKQFFDEVVKPFVSSKMHKTFLDNYLSGDYDRLVKYINSSVEFNRLNVLEKILLAEVFPEHAKHIESFIVDAVQSQPLAPIRYDKLFKIALSLDSQDAEGGDGGDGDAHDEMMLEDAIPAPKSQTTAMRNRKVAPMVGGGGPGFGGADMKMKRMEMAEAMPMMAMSFAAPAPPAAASMAFDSYSDYSMKEKRLDSPAPAIFKEIEKTEEWAETNYYKVQYIDPQLVQVNEFWRDYVQYVVARQSDNNNNVAPFLSKYITLPTLFTSAIFALAVLDLPFSTKDNEVRNRDGKVHFVPNTPVIIYHQELVSTNIVPESNVLVSQHFFDPSNRYSYENNEQNEIYINQEFLSSKVYGALVVVANLSSKQKKLDVLLQIPKGSVPVGPFPFYTHGESMELAPYSTHRFEYFFYFPKSGQFPHFPSHISEKDKVIATVDPFTFHVVESPTIVNQLSWEYIANNGTNQAILEYLQKENLNRVSIHHLYPKLSNADFWRQVVAVLKSKRFYDLTIWSFAILHKDAHYCQDYLANNYYSFEVGDAIQSALLTTHPMDRGDFSYLEYAPLVNARTHQIGDKRQILNDKLDQQYKRICNLLTYTVHPSDRDLVSLVYYLLVQDRYDETIKTMKRVGNTPAVSLPVSPLFTPISNVADVPDAHGEDKKRKLTQEEKQKEKEEKKKEKERIKEEKKREKEEKKREKEERKKKEDEEKRLKKLAKKSKTEASATTSSGSETVQGITIHHDEEEDTHASGEYIDVTDFNEPSCLPDLQIQYDYLISYLDFFNANPAKAKEISEKYKNFPVQRWNALFRDLHNKIQQINNTVSDAMEVEEAENDRDRRHAKMVSTEPSFDVNMEANRTISVNYANLSEINVSYYIMDIELLFSTNPFVQQEMGQFMYISPNKKESFPLKEKNGSFTINIPDEFKNSNIVVDCHSAGIHHNLTVYSNNIAVQITEKAGQLRVIERQTKKPIAKAYIKVYEKSKSGKVQFWKDGYSDIAGYFDYTSVSTGNINDVSKLSILILHNQFGALIREAKPPAM